MSRDDSTTPLPKKLGITESTRVALVGAPGGFAQRIGVTASVRGAADAIVFFATRHAELARLRFVIRRKDRPAEAAARRSGARSARPRA